MAERYRVPEDKNSSLSSAGETPDDEAQEQ